MVAKESVRARMEDREVGISYTEFSYMLLQAFDFHGAVRATTNCELQIGGSDQWGNITAGIDLMPQKTGQDGLLASRCRSSPTPTARNSARPRPAPSGSIRNEPASINFYQFWINTDDRDVIRYLKYFTFLPKEEIEALEKKHAENPGAREAHKALAQKSTRLIHGEIAMQKHAVARAIFFSVGREHYEYS